MLEVDPEWRKTSTCWRREKLARHRASIGDCDDAEAKRAGCSGMQPTRVGPDNTRRSESGRSSAHVDADERVPASPSDDVSTLARRLPDDATATTPPRVLEAGMCLTVEPGCYFIDALLEPALATLCGRVRPKPQMPSFRCHQRCRRDRV